MVWLIRVQRYYKKTGYANFREEKWKKMQILEEKK